MIWSDPALRTSDFEVTFRSRSIRNHYFGSWVTAIFRVPDHAIITISFRVLDHSRSTVSISGPHPTLLISGPSAHYFRDTQAPFPGHPITISKTPDHSSETTRSLFPRHPIFPGPPRSLFPGHLIAFTPRGLLLVFAASGSLFSEQWFALVSLIYQLINSQHAPQRWPDTSLALD